MADPRMNPPSTFCGRLDSLECWHCIAVIDERAAFFAFRSEMVSPVSNVFISYCHRDPIARVSRLAELLGGAGHDVFYDAHIPLGARWSDEIERQLRESDFFVALLTPHSICSEFVVCEIRLAHRLSKSTPPVLRILPVREDTVDVLPYELGSYLDPIHMAWWTSNDSVDTISQRLLASMKIPTMATEADPVRDAQSFYDKTEKQGVPIPAAEPELETGTLRLDSPFYIRRKADNDAERQVSTSGSTTIVKGPRQIGKSSLLARMHSSAKLRGVESFYLDFQLVDEPRMQDLDSLLRYLEQRIARAFRTKIRPTEHWDDAVGAKDNVTYFIEDALLADCDTTYQFIFDEADRVFSQPYRDDFFSTIRGWHNLRATNDEWHRVSIVIGHSTSPNLWIQDVNQSPFNVGYRIRLDDFNTEQVAELVKAYGVILNDAEIDSLFKLVGGHPYLVRLVLYNLARHGWRLSHVTDVALREDGLFAEHLHGLFWLLKDDQGIGSALRDIIRKGCCDHELHYQRLQSGGLVRGIGRDSVQMRCQLYHEYFGRHL